MTDSLSPDIGGEVVMQSSSGEHQAITSLFEKLMIAPVQVFPARREQLAAPRLQGVYVIYSPSGQVLHVGATPRGKNGIANRLRNHMSAQSSFVQRHLKGDGSVLRQGYTFRCLVVENPRVRALLEAFTIGHLCPAHIGYGDTGDLLAQTSAAGEDASC